MSNVPLDKIELVAEVNGQQERVISLNIGLTVYFPIPFSSCLDAIYHLLNVYLTRVDWSTFKFQNLSGTAKGYKKIAPSARPTIVDWMERKRRYGSACTIWLKDQQSTTDAADNLVDLFARDVATKEFDSNYLRILFPRNIIEQHGRNSFLEWICNMLAPVPYYSAHLGYTLGTSTLLQVSPFSTLMNERLYAVGKRFLGVEIEKPHLENYEMKKFTRSPGWVTFLSNDLLVQVGGIESLKKSLQGDFGYMATKFGGGIRAGELPQVGDRNRQENALVEQRALAGKLEPLYSPMPAKLFSNKEHEETLAWLRRLLQE